MDLVDPFKFKEILVVDGYKKLRNVCTYYTICICVGKVFRLLELFYRCEFQLNDPKISDTDLDKHRISASVELWLTLKS